MVEVGFTGGKALKAKLKDIAKKLGESGTVRVGFLENATYPDGTSVAMVAAIQNFGAPGAGVPARPFFTGMVEREGPTWGDKVAKVVVATGYDTARTLGLMGREIADELQDSIRETQEPPLSPVTIMLRSMRRENPDLKVTGATVGEAAARVAAGESPLSDTSTKPLIDTGDLLNAVDYEISVKP